MREKEVVEGVRLVPLPGHTPGSIGVVVDTEKGPYVIAGDAVNMYGNLKGNPAARQPYLMGGVFTDLMAAWKSLELVDEIVGQDISRVIPGHDPLVFERKRYPQDFYALKLLLSATNGSAPFQPEGWGAPSLAG